VSVCLSVCLSQVSVLPKWLNIGSMLYDSLVFWSKTLMKWR